MVEAEIDVDVGVDIDVDVDVDVGVAIIGASSKLMHAIIVLRRFTSASRL